MKFLRSPLYIFCFVWIFFTNPSFALSIADLQSMICDLEMGAKNETFKPSVSEKYIHDINGLGDTLEFTSPSASGEPKTDLTLSTYNVENLDVKKAASAVGKEIALEIKNVINPDIMAFQEIGSLDALQTLLAQDPELAANYEIAYLKGNDSFKDERTGVVQSRDVALIFRKGMGYHFKYHSTRKLQGTTIDGKPRTAFARDLPFLIAYQMKGSYISEEVEMIVAPVHLKAQEGRIKDPNERAKKNESNDYVRRNEEAAAEMFTKYFQALFGKDVPIFLMGDFNSPLLTAPTLEGFRTNGWKNVLAESPLDPKYKTTHYSVEIVNTVTADQQRSSQAIMRDKSQLDAILQSSGSEKQVTVGQVETQKNPFDEIPMNSTVPFKQLNKRKSDHRWIKVKTNILLNPIAINEKPQGN